MEVSFENAQVLFMPIFIILIIAIFYLKSQPKPIYLLDYACCEPPSLYRIPNPRFIEHARLLMDPKLARFQMRILERAGLGDKTCAPPAMHYAPPQDTLDSGQEEFHLVIFSAIDELFAKIKLVPGDIDILVTNCSSFCPSPSLSSMIVNKYRMKTTIKTFSLSGMGCSASPISVDLANGLLQNYPNSRALIVSTEILTHNIYSGVDRSMHLPICLFRMGSAAILLTNKQADRSRAKYRLLHIVRTHIGSNDIAYNSASQEEDAEGILGVKITKDLVAAAGEALKFNITTLGPLVLPMSEMVRFGFNFIAREIFVADKMKVYVPNFNRVFDHFCVHAGGRAVIDKLQMVLQLSDHQVEASRMTLHRFGNTSSSSIWYELSYTEAKGRMKRGDCVWQIAFGTGFKCNSVVWKCNRDIKMKSESDGFGAWRDCVDKYPVDIPEIYKW